MHRVDNSTAAAALPAPSAAGPNPDHYYTGGNPGGGTPATIVDAEWLNMVQEEISKVITDSGAALDKSNRGQLSTAVSALITAALPSLNGSRVELDNATFEAGVADGEAVRWDSGNARFDEAVADGSADNRAIGIADVTNSKVIVYGETPAGLMSGMTAGARQWLDGATPGALTETAPDDAIKIGIAKSATVLFVDIDARYAEIFPQNLHYQEQRASGTTGPVYTAAAWRKAELNTEVLDDGGNGSVASDQITLAAGTYVFEAVVITEAVGTDNTLRARLYNASDSAVIVQGTNLKNEGANDGVAVTVRGKFTIAASKNIELQIYPAATTLAASALTSGDVEIYTDLFLTRVK